MVVTEWRKRFRSVSSTSICLLALHHRQARVHKTTPTTQPPDVHAVALAHACAASSSSSSSAAAAAAAAANWMEALRAAAWTKRVVEIVLCQISIDTLLALAEVPTAIVPFKRRRSSSSFARLSSGQLQLHAASVKNSRATARPLPRWGLDLPRKSINALASVVFVSWW